MRVLGIRWCSVHPEAAFPELRVGSDPDGTPHEHLDIDEMFWPQPHTPLAFDYSPQTMESQYRFHVAGGFPPRYPVGEIWLGLVEACFDTRYESPLERRCECTTDEDCTDGAFGQSGVSCGGPFAGCLEEDGSRAECPIVYIDIPVEGCCGDGTVQSEPVQILAPAEPGTDLYDQHGCSDPNTDDPVCLGMMYYIGQGFLDNTVSGHFDGRRQWRQRLRCFYFHL